MDAGVENRRGDTDYDAFAPYFRAYSGRRAAFIDAVDAVVLRSIGTGARSMLDVGAGDGIRAVRIAEAAGISTLVLAEPSAAMRAACLRRGATEVWASGAEELPDSILRFDVITCLWNVLGHVAGGPRRIAALRRMRALLAPGGSLFLDVNNRYNVVAYGALATLRRMVRDVVMPSERNGDVAFTWPVEDGKEISARTHVFRPGEVADLLRASGLRVEHRYVVDYSTGELRRSVIQGQLLYHVRPDER